MKTKTQRFTELLTLATPARIVTEILTDGKNFGFSGKPVTTPAQRRGLKRFARDLRRMNLDTGSALWRKFSGGQVDQLPLP